MRGQNARKQPTSLALASLEARVLLVDDVNAALTANHAVFAMAGHKRFERVLDLHCTVPRKGPVSLKHERAP